MFYCVIFIFLTRGNRNKKIQQEKDDKLMKRKNRIRKEWKDMSWPEAKQFVTNNRIDLATERRN